ncbi:MAG: TIGR03009 domain-containing protein [Zavarzinella sp.]|nr:TIGR03009 domain-containing protein [Zavarzinella sp.]
MRHLGLALTALLFAGVIALAQAPGSPASKNDATPAATDPQAAAQAAKNREFLDKYLQRWSQRMEGINALETKVVLSEVADGAKTVYTGDASLMKPNFATLLLKEQQNPGNTKKWRHFLADGQFLWEYQYSQKVARVSQLPKEGIGDNPVMAFLFGMKVGDVKKRYDLSIDVFDNKKFNENFLHIMILPKLKEDMQEFERAELVLWKNNEDRKYADVWMLPARLWFKSPNGNQIQWDFQEMVTKKGFPKDHFKAPAFPDKEWRSEWATPPKPTVTRTVAPTK